MNSHEFHSDLKNVELKMINASCNHNLHALLWRFSELIALRLNYCQYLPGFHLNLFLVCIKGGKEQTGGHKELLIVGRKIVTVNPQDQ